MAVAGLMVFSLSSFMPAKNVFTAAEQQQVSIATPGLFAQSQAFNVDFEIFRAKEYSFPLPVGKATLLNNNVLRISTSKGDAVKAMLEGYVRLSRIFPPPAIIWRGSAPSALPSNSVVLICLMLCGYLSIIPFMAFGFCLYCVSA